MQFNQQDDAYQELASILESAGYTVEQIADAAYYGYEGIRKAAALAGNPKSYPPWEQLDPDFLSGLCTTAQEVALGRDVTAHLPQNSGEYAVMWLFAARVRNYLKERCRH